MAVTEPPAIAEVRRRLRLHPSSVGQARRLVRDALAAAERTDLSDTGQLLVTELVTNALLHAGTYVELSVSAADAGLLVLVSDGSTQRPMPVDRQGSVVDTGRGLLLVEELSHAWGVMASGRGKTVWFQLDAAPTGELSDRLREAPAAPPTTPDTCTVELLDLPARLHRTWQHHAEALLREYLLDHLLKTPRDEVLRKHAAAGNAVGLLARQVPLPEGSQELRAPGIDVAVEVPRDHVDDFSVLAETLTSARFIAGTSGRPLHRGELADMTGWICEQVERQARGSSPTPWQAWQTGHG
jgi:anti-sigma regulatory factor (Ser/Thr protein kinase)